MTRYLPVILVLFTLLGCSSGRKALQTGNYEEAVYQSLNRLRQSPGNQKASEVLDYAYPELLDYNLNRIERLQATNNPLRWEEIANLYADLNQVYDYILRTPAARDLIREPKDFTVEYETARKRAAEANYQLAEEYMPGARNRDREAAKSAYDYYRQASNWVPRFRDAEIKAEEALMLATVWVQINPIPIHSRALEISNDFFQTKLFEYIRAAPISEYVRFISAKEAAAMGSQPDQVLELSFDEFVVGQTFVRETVRERSLDSVVIGTVAVEENGEEISKDVFGTVQAEVHVFEKTIQSSGRLDIKIVDTWSQQVVAQEKFTGVHTWVDYWGFFNGDKRALSEDDRRKMNNSREVMPPAPQDLFIAFTVPIFDQLTDFVRDHYRYY